MIHETDVPCSDCGTDLVERTVDAGELAIATSLDGQVTLAECPTCGARYYPRETIARLSGATNDPRPRGDS